VGPKSSVWPRTFKDPQRLGPTPQDAPRRGCYDLDMITFLAAALQARARELTRAAVVRADFIETRLPAACR